MGFAKYYKSVVYLLNAAYFTKVINMPVHLKRLIVKNSGSQMGEKHPKQKQRFNHATLFLLFGNLQNYTIEQVYQYPISIHVPLVIPEQKIAVVEFYESSTPDVRLSNPGKSVDSLIL